MDTNYDKDETLYQDQENEKTQLDEISTAGQNADAATSNDGVKAIPQKSAWKRVVAGAGTGLLIGGVSSVLMGMEKADLDAGDQTEGDNHEGRLSNPEWVDDQMQVASTVNDDMSFGEAFAAARAEVGPGGCFEWHGNVYGTYTADEWNNMTAGQRADYGDHFSWNHIDHSASNVAQHSTNYGGASHNAAVTDDSDIEVISVNHPDANDDMVTPVSNQPEDQQVMVDVPQDEPEIEILGVVHDDETGANIGGMTVDGQEIIVIDVDGDMEFDYMAADINGDNQISQEELIDIQGQGLMVNDLGGFSNPSPTDDWTASNDAPDYSTDTYEG